MSHFCVLVIGGDVEAQLARYDENLEYPSYRVKDVSDFEKVEFLEYYYKKGTDEWDKRFESYMKRRKGYFSEKVFHEKFQSKYALHAYHYALKRENEQHYAEFFKKEEPKLWASFDEMYKLKGEDWNGKAWHIDPDGNYGRVSNYNPNSKWDWWCQGGRYRGRLKLKEPYPEAPLYSGWQYGDDDKDYERLKAEGFCDQAFAKDVSNLDDFVPFAIVKDGKWYERGEMGYWAQVSNEKEKDVWKAEVKALLKDLPALTLLTVVDCHI